MKILFINGNPDSTDLELDNYLQKLQAVLEEKENTVKQINLREKEINNCIGCYACWLKTPGICCLKDGQEEILREFLAADLVLYCSPVIMGFVSACLKKTIDRIIPISHPFLRIEENRMRHVGRYTKYPFTALLLHDKSSFDRASAEITDKVFNSSGRRHTFTLNTGSKPEEVAYAINHI